MRLSSARTRLIGPIFLLDTAASVVPKWALMIALSLGICVGQTAANKPPEPEVLGAFYSLDSATQTLKRLPREEYKKHRGGVTSVSDNVVVSGQTSSFRIASNDSPVFVFGLSGGAEAEKVKLFRFAVKGDKREYELGKWKRRDFTPNRGLPVEITKFGESSYKLVPDAPLEPGEYGLTTVDGEYLYTFGVSGK